MKTGAGLINAARGGVVDEKSLIESLDSGKLALQELTLLKITKAVCKITYAPQGFFNPHIGAATNEAQDRIGIN